ARKGNGKVALNGSASGRASPRPVKIQDKALAKTPAKAAFAKKGRKARARQSSIILPDGYRPSENEPFMNERQKIYFRNKLGAWKEELVRQNTATLHIMRERADH